MKNLATPSSIFIFVFSSFTEELCSQPIRGNDRPIGRRFPEHVERRFLDPEYSFDEYFQLGSRRKVGPIKNQLALPNTSMTVLTAWRRPGPPPPPPPTHYSSGTTPAARPCLPSLIPSPGASTPTAHGLRIIAMSSSPDPSLSKWWSL